MGRQWIRSIKPEFFKNEQLGALPAAARLLFVGLWCMADKYGVVLDRPERIRVELFPYDRKLKGKIVDDLLARLEDRGLIKRDKKLEDPCLLVLTFVKHQRMTSWEKNDSRPILENDEKIRRFGG